MQEYWVNVYSPPLYCYENLNRELHSTRFDALKSALNLRAMLGFSVSYRIHVKIGAKSSRSFYPYVWKDGKSVPKMKRNDLNDAMHNRIAYHVNKNDWMG